MAYRKATITIAVEAHTHANLNDLADRLAKSADEDDAILAAWVDAVETDDDEFE